jgi:hypothetical protein
MAVKILYDRAMEDQELRDRLIALEQKIDAAYRASEQTRRYLLWMLIGSVTIFVVPLIGLVFAIPSFLSLYSQLSGL